MKSIRVKFVKQFDLLGKPMKLSSWSKVVKESNPYFDWYRKAKFWKVVEEWEREIKTPGEI